MKVMKLLEATSKLILLNEIDWIRKYQSENQSWVVPESQKLGNLDYDRNSRIFSLNLQKGK